MTLRGRQRTYGVTWLALVLLAAASFVLSKRPLSAFSLPLAMSIAAGKALLIVFFFMHVASYRTSVRLAAVTAVGLIALLAAFMVADVVTRDVSVGARPRIAKIRLSANH